MALVSNRYSGKQMYGMRKVIAAPYFDCRVRKDARAEKTLPT